MMLGIYWQKLILHGKTAGETLCLDFQPGRNALSTAGLRFDPCLALAATLFGLESDLAHTYTEAQAFPFASAELFFLAQEQYYHIQRTFSTEDTHLHLWQDSHWEEVYAGVDAPTEATKPSAYRALLHTLLGVTNATTWYAHTRFTYTPSLSWRESMARIRATNAPYAQAEHVLRERLHRLDTEQLAPLQREYQHTTSVYQHALEAESHIRGLKKQLADLRIEHQQDLRRMHRFHTIEAALIEWQRHAERAQQLSTQAALLRQAEQALSPLLHEQRLLDSEIQRVCTELNTTPDILQRNMQNATARRDELQAAENDYLQAERRLTRFGAQPLSPDALLPIVERRLELLHLRAQESTAKPTRGLGQRQALVLSIAVALLAAGIYFAFQGMIFSLSTVAIAVAICVLSGAATWKLIPKESVLGEVQHHPLQAELQAQAQQIGNLSLMDRDALAAFAAQLRLIEPLRRNRPTPEQLQHAIAEHTMYQQQIASSLPLFTQSQANAQAIEDIRLTHHIDTTLPLTDQLRAVTEQLSRELGQWRRQAAPYGDLPDIRAQDLDTTLQEFAALCEARELMQQRLNAFVDKEESLSQQLALASQHAAPINIAEQASRLVAMEKQQKLLQHDVATTKQALAWLQIALVDDVQHTIATVAATYRNHDDMALAALATQLDDLVTEDTNKTSAGQALRSREEAVHSDMLQNLCLLMWCASAKDSPHALPLIVQGVHMTSPDHLESIWHILEQTTAPGQIWLLTDTTYGQKEAFWQSIVQTQA